MVAEFKAKLGFTPSRARTLMPNLLNVGDRFKGKVGSGKAVASPHPLPACTKLKMLSKLKGLNVCNTSGSVN